MTACYDHNVEPTQRALDAVRVLLEEIGEDPTREGLRDTPRRVVAALLEMTSGSKQRTTEHTEVTFDVGYDEIVVMSNIPFTSLCEHHMLPFAGTVGIAYLPQETDPRVIGASKLVRITEVYARRLQVQERMTSQIADALEAMNPRGIVVVAAAEHQCMACRGVRKTGVVMRTSVVRGVFRSDGGVRAEAMKLIFGG